MNTPTVNQDLLFEQHRFIVDSGQTPLRLDKYLSGRIPNTTRTKIQSAIDAKLIHVNNQSVKSSYHIQPHDLIQVSLSTPPILRNIEPENIPLDIVYEDDVLLVVNKPSGMVVHPGCENWTGTLVNGLLYHLQSLPGGKNRPGLIHRIDKDTSGLLVIAKTEYAMTVLAEQFYHHTINRTYIALVWGIPEPASGTIDVSVGRSHKDRRIMAAFPSSQIIIDPTTSLWQRAQCIVQLIDSNLINRCKNAVTHYETLQTFRYVALLSCRLETGRTHQIRVHMKHIGHPIFSDAPYGGQEILKGQRSSKYKAFIQNCFNHMPRQGLHAKSLGFIHPITNQELYFEVPLPDDFQTVLHKWGRYLTTK